MQRDPAELPGGSKLGVFWDNCKSKRKCERAPYDRLLTNPVLKTDYRSQAAARDKQVRPERERLTGLPARSGVDAG